MPGWKPDAALRPPDFAIVGAPKCGTTALFSYLAAHPVITMSRLKEPCFWSRDIDTVGRPDRATYDALWDGAPPGALRGEATPIYLQSLVAIPDLLDARPDIRLIAMIRNPVEMVASRHANHIALYLDDVADLETAWRLQERRLRGEALPRRCPVPSLLQYRANAAIGDQLGRFLALVPAEQRIVIVYDDFRTDTRREYLRALALLGLADDGRADFAPVNARLTPRWTRLPDLQDWLRKRMALPYRPVSALAHAVGLHPFALLNKANLRAAPSKPLRPAFEAELIVEFLPQIEKVERLLGRDLTSWKTPRSAG